MHHSINKNIISKNKWLYNAFSPIPSVQFSNIIKFNDRVKLLFLIYLQIYYPIHGKKHAGKIDVKRDFIFGFET